MKKDTYFVNIGDEQVPTMRHFHDRLAVKNDEIYRAKQIAWIGVTISLANAAGLILTLIFR